MEETNIINLVKSNPSKDIKSKDNKKKIFFRIFNNKYIYIPSVLILIVISQCIKFKYEDFDKEIITDKIKKLSGWVMSEEQALFINGIIRKNKPKNCLEVGVAKGGSSILILNAIKDIENSFLVSLDLNNEVYNNINKKTGYRVKQFFPELTDKWKLYTGEQPHIFLDKLKIKFDFLFLDTAHVAPGEIINFIEILPFLNDQAIVIIHDIFWHFLLKTKEKFFPSCISLFTNLYGDKILLNKKGGDLDNIGAVFLYQNQEKFYLNYFLLLFNFWEYIPKDKQIYELRLFIKKYYNNIEYIKIFDLAVKENKRASLYFNSKNNSKEKKKIISGLGKRWDNNDNW